MASVAADITSGPSMTLTYDTSPFGTSMGFSDGTGSSVSYLYDAANRLTAASIIVSGTTSTDSLSYDDAGRLTGETRHSTLSISTPYVATALSYDNANRLTDITHTSSSAGALSDFSST